MQIPGCNLSYRNKNEKTKRECWTLHERRKRRKNTESFANSEKFKT